MRWRVVAAFLAAAAVTISAGFVLVDNIRPNRPSTPAASTIGRSSAARPPVLPGLSAKAARPAARAVTAAVARALEAFPAGELVSGTVIDVDTGRTLWGLGASTPAAPASTLKLLTAAAALRRLGPGFRFKTSVRRKGRTIYLIGGGDPTLVFAASANDVPVGYPKPATLSELARRTATALPTRGPIHVCVDLTAWPFPTLGAGWSKKYIKEGDVTPPSSLELDGGRTQPADFDSRRTPYPAGQAAAAFVTLLRKDGVPLDGAVTYQQAPVHAARVAVVSSPPLPALVQRMLTDSDNDLAEALGRAVALKDGLPATFAGAATAVGRAVTAFGVRSSDLVLYDTSGLSHFDRVSPSALVAVLRAATTRRRRLLAPIAAGLPVAGFTGTLADRFRGKDRLPGAGLVRAKTGWLTGVNTLAGLVVDRSGRLLAFALLGSGTIENEAVQAGLDAVASGLAQLT